MQFCPAAQKAPETQLSTAASKSASSMTMTGLLEPSSIPIFLSPAFRVTSRPASTPPVKDTIRTLGSVTSASPTSPPGPVTTLRSLGGKPASRRSSASFSAERGVTVAGFNTTAFPPAMAGPTLWATRFSGSLKGVMAATTPMGTRLKYPRRFSEPFC